LIAGRYLNERDNENSAKAVVISQSAAKEIWPGEDPIGKLIQLDSDRGTWPQVVGVVPDLKTGNPEAIALQLYFRMLQHPVRAMTVVVRPNLDPRSSL